MSPPAGAAPAPASAVVPKTENALANLRARALDIQARLLELSDGVAMLRDGVGSTSARNAAWPTFLAKFATLSKLFAQLTEELDRAVLYAGLRNYVLHPRADGGGDPELVPNMLRTRLDPRVEADLLELQADYERDVAGGKGGEATEEDVKAAEAVLKERVSLFNLFIEGALERFDDARDISDISEPREPDPAPPGLPPKGQALLSALANGAPIQ